MDKTMDVQIIHDAKGAPAFAVVPWPEFERLRACDTEDAALIAAGNAARGDETYPAEVAARLVAGGVPLKVIREWRGLSQAALGDAADVATQYISQIERGARDLGKKAAAKLAAALNVPAAMLMGPIKRE